MNKPWGTPWVGANVTYTAKDEDEFKELGGERFDCEPHHFSTSARVTAVHGFGVVDLMAKAGRALLHVGYDPDPRARWGNETPGTWVWIKG